MKFAILVLLIGLCNYVYGDLLVAWDFDASGTSLTAIKGTKVSFTWIANRDLYLLKQPCTFDGSEILLAPASREGTYI